MAVHAPASCARRRARGRLVRGTKSMRRRRLLGNGDAPSWWNGRRWKITRLQLNINALLNNTISVSCSPDRSCMAVTAEQGSAINVAGAYQWNGRGWMDRSPASGQNYAGLWAFPARLIPSA